MAQELPPHCEGILAERLLHLCTFLCKEEEAGERFLLDQLLGETQVLSVSHP